jgi:hypothetical protein
LTRRGRRKTIAFLGKTCFSFPLNAFGIKEKEEDKCAPHQLSSSLFSFGFKRLKRTTTV